MSSSNQKPNIILIGIDSLRADHMGVYGYHRNTTPHIAKFAESATLFVEQLQPAYSDHKRLREHAYRN